MLKRLIMICCLFAMTAGYSMATFAQEGDTDQPLKVVFLGDSITQAGVGPNGYVTLIDKAIHERHPDKNIEIIGAGISGNKVPDLQARLDNDVLAHKPNLVMIYIGINDVWHWNNNRGTTKEDFEIGLNDVIDRIEAVGSKVVLCTPSMIGEKTDGSNKLDEMLEEYSAISRSVAKSQSVNLLDLRKKFVRELKILNTDQAENKILTSDGVHLNEAGNEFVKDCMLPMIESVLFGKKLQHVVMFKFKEDTKEADINRVFDAFAKLPEQIDTIVGYEAGVDNSPESLNQGYTHCFIVSFSSLADRDAYLPHQAHKDFVQLLAPFVDGALVVDFWSNQ
ncbi:MAG: Dabb family protein [Pirellulaceae bacterium]